MTTMIWLSAKHMLSVGFSGFLYIVVIHMAYQWSQVTTLQVYLGNGDSSGLYVIIMSR